MSTRNTWDWNPAMKCSIKPDRYRCLGALGSLCWFDVIVIGQRGHHFAMYYSVPPLEVLL